MLKYDFNYVNLAAKYLETGDSDAHLRKLERQTTPAFALRKQGFAK